MKKLLMLVVAIFMCLSFCGKKEPPVVLEKDTPLYTFATTLAQRFPDLDPENNKVLVSGKGFEINAASFVKTLSLAVGSQRSRFLSMPDAQMLQIFTNNLSQFGEQMLMAEAAKNVGIEVSEVKVDSFLNAHAARVGGMERIEKHAEDSGLSMAFLRANLRMGLLIDAYQKQLLEEKDVEVSDFDLQVAYEEMLQDTLATVRHILMMTRGKTEAEKDEIITKMTDVLKKARRGDDFARLAKQYSEDSGSKDKGGLYENFPRGQMVKPFEDASFSLPIGAVSDLVETQFGYHIIKVVDRQTPDIVYEEVLPELKEQIRTEKQGIMIAQHLEELKAKYKYKMNAFESEESE